jgi:hypothetical protein
MMHSSGNRILLNTSGEADLLFDVDDLHDRLMSSFRACDIKNSWIADDILIALHCGLKNSKMRSARTDEALDQLHAILLKVLHDNGFSEVARHFLSSLQNNSQSALEQKITEQLKQIDHVISRKLVYAISTKIINLGYPVSDVSSLLIREICRLEIARKKTPSEEPQIVAQGNYANFFPFSEQFVDWDWNILQLKAAGNLFNSIRIDIYPVRLAESLGMDFFMELQFMGAWEKLLNKVVNYLKNCLRELPDGTPACDYLSIVPRELDQLILKFDLGQNPPIINDIQQSLKAAFSEIFAHQPKIDIKRR